MKGPGIAARMQTGNHPGKPDNGRRVNVSVFSIAGPPFCGGPT